MVPRDRERLQIFFIKHRGCLMSMAMRDLYWTAGFLEGDGSFLFGKHEQLQVTAAQVQKWPLERLQRLYGGSISGHQPENPKWSFVYRWILTGPTAAGLMMTLYSLMSEHRRGQIKQALAGWKTKPVSNGMKPACPQGHAYTEENTRLYRGSRRCRSCQRERDNLRTVLRRAA